MERTVVDTSNALRRRIAVWTPWGAVPADRRRDPRLRAVPRSGSVPPPGHEPDVRAEPDGKKRLMS
jgi:hypothetical protein